MEGVGGEGREEEVVVGGGGGVVVLGRGWEVC